MAIMLDNRAELRQEIYARVGLSGSDTALTEHETVSGDMMNRIIQQATFRAQEWIVEHVDATRWIAQTDVSDARQVPDGRGRLKQMPATFLKASGDDRVSCLSRADGSRWGQMITLDERSARGDKFWFENDRLWFTPGARIPSDLEIEYVYYIPEWSDDATPSGGTGWERWPESWRMLVPAFGAVLVTHTALFPGGLELMVRLQKGLEDEKRWVRSSGRRSNEPRRMRQQRPLSDRWFHI